MKVALAQIEPIFGNWEATFLKHKDYVQKAIEQKASVIVFPEMSMTGYNLKDRTPEMCVNAHSDKLREVARQSMQIDLIFGFPEVDENYRQYISSAYCSKGEIVHIHRKIFLPINGMFNDSKDFSHGSDLKTFETDNFRMGLLICRDMWHDEAIVSYVKKNVQCIVIPSNIPLRNVDETGPAIHGFVERMIRGYAERNSLFIVYVNRVGFEEGTCFYGGSMVADPFGNVLVQSPFLEESLLCADIDMKVLQRKLTTIHLHHDRRDSIVRDAFGGDER
ncbi:MAG: hypothetical protein PHI40_04750 [Caldisericia bacterium]|nr:hypothetical protein [Caldisericia bacterium]MDD4614702.1 hypothetical protein [Caldisericia bacterium]